MDYDISTTGLVLVLLLVVWDLVWKGFALWRAGRNNQQGWFIVLLLINSVGVLPIVYLLTHRPKNEKP